LFQVVHAASPWHLNGKTWLEYRDPAVKGTIKILEQATKVPSASSKYVLTVTLLTWLVQA
jgi:hypothetical protein